MKLFINKIIKMLFCFLFFFSFAFVENLYSDSFSLVIDASYNMVIDESIEIAEEAAVGTVESMLESDTVSVVIFTTLPPPLLRRKLKIGIGIGNMEHAKPYKPKLSKYIIETKKCTIENKKEIIEEINSKVRFIKRKFSEYREALIKSLTGTPYLYVSGKKLIRTSLKDLKEVLEISYRKVHENFVTIMFGNVIVLFSNASLEDSEGGFMDRFYDTLGFYTKEEKEFLGMVKMHAKEGIELTLKDVNEKFSKKMIDGLEDIDSFYYYPLY